MHIEKSKPGKKIILKNVQPSLSYDQKTGQKQSFGQIGSFWPVFLAITQAVLEIFQNAFFSWLRFFNMHLLVYILPYLGRKKFWSSEGGLSFFRGLGGTEGDIFRS